MNTVCINAYSKNQDSKLATEEIVHTLKESIKEITPPLAFGVVFCGPEHNLSYIIQKLTELTNSNKIIGCTTAGEFTQDEHIHNGVVVHLVFSDDMITKKIVTKGMSNNLLNVLRKLTEGFKEFRNDCLEKGFQYGYSLVLTDGMSIEGEALISLLQTRTHIQHNFFWRSFWRRRKIQKNTGR